MRDRIKLNSFAVELRRDWELNPYSPIDLFSIVLSKLPDLTIIFYPMSENTSGMCVKDINQIDDSNIDNLIGIDYDNCEVSDYDGQQKSINGKTNRNDDNTSIFTPSSDMVVCINSNMSKGRQRFTLAHELYHLLFEDDKRNLIICENSNTEDSEIEANIFASYLIMPYEGLERYYRTNNIDRWTLEDTIRAEQFFQISHHAMLFRLKEQDFISKEECLKFRKVYIGYEARINGFSDDLYVPSDESRKYYSLGKYIRSIEKAFSNNRISNGKRDELLLDAFRSDLTFNFNENI